RSRPRSIRSRPRRMGIIMSIIMGLRMNDAVFRSSPRKRGSRAASKEQQDSRLRGNERGVEQVPSSHLLRLMAWLSPACPVGAFSYPGGIEGAVEAGGVPDAAALKDWLSVMLAGGGGFCDAVLFAHAHRAVLDGDDKALHDVAELA